MYQNVYKVNKATRVRIMYEEIYIRFQYLRFLPNKNIFLRKKIKENISNSLKYEKNQNFFIIIIRVHL